MKVLVSDEWTYEKKLKKKDFRFLTAEIFQGRECTSSQRMSDIQRHVSTATPAGRPTHSPFNWRGRSARQQVVGVSAAYTHKSPTNRSHHATSMSPVLFPSMNSFKTAQSHLNLGNTLILIYPTPTWGSNNLFSANISIFHFHWFIQLG